MGSHGSCGEEHPDRIGCPPPRGGLQASPVRSRTGRAPAGRGPRIARGGRAGKPFVGTAWSGMGRPRAPQWQWQGCCGAPSQARRHRQERFAHRRAAKVSGQGAPQICGLATLPILWAAAFGPASPQLRPGPGARPQGERRVHGAALSHSPPRSPSFTGRGRVVGETRHRCSRRGSKAVAPDQAWRLAHGPGRG